MNWLTELLETTTKIKDPFLRFLLRITYLLLLIFFCYLAYLFISGKIINWGGERYSVQNPNSPKPIRDSNVVDPSKKKSDTNTLKPSQPGTQIKHNFQLQPKPGKESRRKPDAQSPQKSDRNVQKQPVVNTTDTVITSPPKIQIKVSPGDVTDTDLTEVTERIKAIIGKTDEPIYLRFYYIKNEISSKYVHRLIVLLNQKGYINDFLMGSDNLGITPGITVERYTGNNSKRTNSVSIKVGDLSAGKIYQ